MVLTNAVQSKVAKDGKDKAKDKEAAANGKNGVSGSSASKK